MKFLLPLLPLLLAACQGQADAPVAAAPVGQPPAKLGLCAGCHGNDGRATMAGYPHLAGQDALYLRTSMAAYRDGSRAHAQMQAIAGLLDDAEIALLADWYASQPASPGQTAP